MRLFYGVVPGCGLKDRIQPPGCTPACLAETGLRRPPAALASPGCPRKHTAVMQACRRCEQPCCPQSLQEVWLLVDEFLLAEAERALLKLLRDLDKASGPQRVWGQESEPPSGMPSRQSTLDAEVQLQLWAACRLLWPQGHPRCLQRAVAGGRLMLCNPATHAASTPCDAGWAWVEG